MALRIARSQRSPGRGLRKQCRQIALCKYALEPKYLRTKAVASQAACANRSTLAQQDTPVGSHPNRSRDFPRKYVSIVHRQARSPPATMSPSSTPHGVGESTISSWHSEQFPRPHLLSFVEPVLKWFRLRQINSSQCIMRASRDTCRSRWLTLAHIAFRSL